MTHRAYTCKNAGKSHLVQKIESVNNRTDTVARSLITVLLCRSLVLLFSVAIRYVFPVFWLDGFTYCLLITARKGDATRRVLKVTQQETAWIRHYGAH